MMSGVELRPLSTGEIFDRSFTLYRRHFLLFFGISAVPHLLTLAIGLVQVLFLQRWTFTGHGGRAPLPAPAYGSGFSLVVTLLGLVVGLMVYVFTQGGTVQAISDIYLGRPATISSSLKRVWEDFANLTGVVLLNGVAIVISFAMLVIPGIYVSCRLLVCLPAALVEHRGPRDALSRSWSLTKDFTIRAFLLYLLYIVLLFGVGGLLGAPIGVAMAASQFNLRLLPILMALQQVTSTLAEVLISPLFLIGACIFYFDLRVRKEAFDLQYMMDPTSERLSQGGDSVPSIR